VKCWWLTCEVEVTFVTSEVFGLPLWIADILGIGMLADVGVLVLFSGVGACVDCMDRGGVAGTLGGRPRRGGLTFGRTGC
jgi:hypothetical protein